MLALTVLAIGILLVLIAEAAVRIRAKLRYGYLFGIQATYKYDEALGLMIPGGHRCGQRRDGKSGRQSIRLGQPAAA